MNIFPSALAFLFGVCLVQSMAQCHSEVWLLAVLLVGLSSCIVQHRRLAPWFIGLCLVFAGAAWASWRAELYLDQRLPDDYAGKDVLVSGRVLGLPVLQDRVQRFEFVLDAFDINHEWPELAWPPEKLRLSWYYADPVNPGERWQLRVRLKPPHGFLNPGGFDYEGWLYQQGIHATGYVRDKDKSANRLLAAAPLSSLDRLRQSVLQRITRVLNEQPHAGVITALAVGDRSAIDARQWQQLIATGTNHLVAISGLHIGLAAGFAWFISRRLAVRVLPAKVLLWLPAQHIAIIASLICALLYALLAGMSLPTQRALFMLLSFSLAALLRRQQWAFDALALALFVILLWQPVSVLAPGFWFSFLAVAVIFYVFGDRSADRNSAGERSKYSLWLRWGGIQFAIALALLPLSLFMFQQSSLLAPLANFIMVPYVSLLVVPLVLLALLLMPLWPWASDSLLVLAASLIELIWPWLEWLASLEFITLQVPQPALWSVLLALLGIGCMLAPRRWLSNLTLRAAASLLLLPLLLLRPESPELGDFELYQLDVGQGLSVVVRTHDHTLVYDTGAPLGAELDAGKTVVLPFLRQQGVTRLDTLVVSHGDSDHIGGAASVLQSFPEATLIGQDIEALSAPVKTACVRGQRWRWDGVEFEFLHPEAVQAVASSRRNNHSCILRVSNAAGAALLSGDIERSVELALLSSDQTKLAATVLVVPHHGSKTSSTPDFIAAVQPTVALIAAGYRNRYRLPAAEIVERYRHAGAKPLVSGQEGMLSLRFSASRGVELSSRYRRDQRHYWNHLLPTEDE